MTQSNFVFDVNIYISYIIKGKLDELFILSLERNFEVFISNALIDELSEVPAREKFKRFLKKPVFEFVDSVKQFGYLVEPHPSKIESPI